MKLTDVISVWDILHIKDPGDIGYCDLVKAIDKVVGVENDVDSSIGVRIVEEVRNEGIDYGKIIKTKNQEPRTKHV